MKQLTALDYLDLKDSLESPPQTSIDWQAQCALLKTQERGRAEELEAAASQVYELFGQVFDARSNLIYNPRIKLEFNIDDESCRFSDAARIIAAVVAIEQQMPAVEQWLESRRDGDVPLVNPVRDILNDAEQYVKTGKTTGKQATLHDCYGLWARISDYHSRAMHLSLNAGQAYPEEQRELDVAAKRVADLGTILFDTIQGNLNRTSADVEGNYSGQS